MDEEELNYWIDLRVDEEINALMGDDNDEEISPTFLLDTSPWLFNVSGSNTRGATPDIPLSGAPFDVGQPPLSQKSHFDVSNFNLLHPNQIYQAYIWAKCLVNRTESIVSHKRNLKKLAYISGCVEVKPE
jgi:hypothetical protein